MKENIVSENVSGKGDGLLGRRCVGWSVCARSIKDEKEYEIKKC